MSSRKREREERKEGGEGVAQRAKAARVKEDGEEKEEEEEEEEQEQEQGDVTASRDDVVEEAKHLRDRIVKEGSIKFTRCWSSSRVPIEALRLVLGEMGSIAGNKLEVITYPFGHECTTALFESIPPGAVRVRRLDVARSGVGDTGAETLARALEANTTITELDLRNSGITEAGVRHLAAALRANTSLRWLVLGGNDVGTGGVIALAEALAGNDTLERLGVGNTSCSIEGVRALAGAAVAHTSLTGLDFERVPLTAEDARAFAEMVRATRSLRRLNLTMSLCSKEVALAFQPGIVHAAKLTHLGLSGCALGDECATALAAALSSELCALAGVDACFCEIGTAGAVALAGALRVNCTLTRLNVAGNTAIGDEGVRAVSEALKANRTLGAMNLRMSGFESTAALVKALEANRTLAVLDLSGNEGLGSGGLIALAAALGRPGCALEALDLRGCGLNDEIGRALADSLATNTTPTIVVLDDEDGLAEHVEDEILAATERNRRLREESVAQRDYLRSAAALDDVPWIAEDVLVNIVAEYAGRAWTDVELALQRRYGSPFLSDGSCFMSMLKDL